MSENRFTTTHCWIRLEGKKAVVGMTDFGQEEMSELTSIELPEVGEHFDAEDEVALVESVRLTSEVLSPVSGIILEVNEALLEQPELVNQDPFGKGWLFKMKPDDLSDIEELLDVDEYEAQLPQDEEE